MYFVLRPSAPFIYILTYQKKMFSPSHPCQHPKEGEGEKKKKKKKERRVPSILIMLILETNRKI
jgi:hypothetical protein